MGTTDIDVIDNASITICIETKRADFLTPTVTSQPKFSDGKSKLIQRHRCRRFPSAPLRFSWSRRRDRFAHTHIFNFFPSMKLIFSKCIEQIVLCLVGNQSFRPVAAIHFSFMIGSCGKLKKQFLNTIEIYKHIKYINILVYVERINKNTLNTWTLKILPSFF